MYAPIDTEELLSCPYNKAHQIKANRMQTHLTKCEKNHPDVKVMTCTFNSTHIIQEKEYKLHLQTCPNRNTIQKGNVQSEQVKIRGPVPVPPSPCEERWSDDDCPSYNPEEICKSRPVLRQLKVKSAAERKNFRYEERKRIQKLKETDTESACENDNNQASVSNILKDSQAANVDRGNSAHYDPYQVSKLLSKVELCPRTTVIQQSKSHSLNSHRNFEQ